ncbi:Low-affinity potassium transport protein [Cyphellophora attinorum]|uniref:Potassium transport protein n=1 Tax=Cyphellophora attinorum TaxID=1664694 RepID=A0A0N1NW52_9EURO|nr:Low-affinity potassium transport protein [Phialophora attinorum]KPI34680.1 Low-affinity potassium transport protein [Phialophora attinorum]
MAVEKKDKPSQRNLGLKILKSVADFFNNKIQPHLEPISFISLHYIYFCGTCMLAAIIFWASSTPSQSVRFIDSFFLVVSAMTEAGLNTVNLSQLNTWQQVMLFLLIIMGSSIFVSIAILHIRKTAMEKRLEELADRKRRRLGIRTLTFSLSKRRVTDYGRKEDAVASGVVQGSRIKDPIPDEEYQPTFASRVRSESTSNMVRPEAPPISAGDPENGQTESGHITFGEDPRPVREQTGRSQLQRRRSFLSNVNRGVAAHSAANHPRYAQPILHVDEKGSGQEHRQRAGSLAKLHNYLDSVYGLLGRNSRFYHLSEKERRALGGIEYDAICVLSWLVPIYFVVFQLCGAIGVGAWLQINRPDTAYQNGLNPFWTGAFFAVSAFNNSGMALLDANATALQTSYYCLLTLSLLILAGNTCFPPFLRLILWTMKKAIPKTSSPRLQKWKTVLTFILDHPRRVYTNLFPAKHTWWLVFSLVLLNGIDWIAFEVLSIGNPVVESIEPKYRVLDGLFQAFAVRAGGFYVVPISGLYPGLQVLYVLMMYVSAFPVTITIRNTNVYEERSLGIFADDQPQESIAAPAAQGGANELLRGLKRTLTGDGGLRKAPTAKSASDWSNQDFLRMQLRGQLGHDIWWISLAVFLIAIIETGQFNRDPVVFSVFNIIFEVVSAYGCVGISTGVPWNAYSFCGAWHTGSKLILCAVMLRGRHRGLPVAIDRAILLPSTTLDWAEEEDAHRKGKSRSASRMRNGNDVSNDVNQVV